MITLTRRALLPDKHNFVDQTQIKKDCEINYSVTTLTTISATIMYVNKCKIKTSEYSKSEYLLLARFKTRF